MHAGSCGAACGVRTIPQSSNLLTFFLFFENNKGDILVSNPPFSKSKDVMDRIYDLDQTINFDISK